MSMRIAHVSATFPPYRGGTGNVCFHNSQQLGYRGHEVHVFTAGSKSSSVVESNGEFTIHRLPTLVRVGNAPVLPALLPSLQGFDIIHLHYPFFGGELTALAAAVSNTPLVITYHQDVHLKGPWSVLELSLRHSIVRATLRAAEQVLFTTLDYSRCSYTRPMLHGHENRISELPNGVDTEAFSTEGPFEELRLKHGFAAGRSVMLLVAGLDRAHYFKGVHIFLQALKHLPPHVKGLIVGEGDMRLFYQQMAERLGVDNRVVFAGRVSDAELPTYYRAADVCVLPSVTMGEAFGLVLVEAMASGKAVIASDLPGVRTLIQHGHDGLLVAPNEPTALMGAMYQLLADKDELRIMGLRGRAKVVEHYRWETIGARLEAIYERILHKPSRTLRMHKRGGQFSHVES